VVVGVVDPGVASGTRRAVAFEVTTTLGDDAPSNFVGPDNGLLVWAAESLGEISAAVDVSQSAAGTPHGATFDGRDVFAPAAAALLNGTTLSELGVPVDPAGLTRLEEPVLAVRPGVIESEVLWVDGFGNVQLSVSSRHATEAGLGDQVEIRPVSGSGSGAGASVRTASARRVAAFADLAPGEIGLIVDSNGHLALVGDQSSAALTLGLAARDRVTVVGVP
jgi:S-adenosylmethionine hydrolase